MTKGDGATPTVNLSFAILALLPGNAKLLTGEESLRCKRLIDLKEVDI